MKTQIMNGKQSQKSQINMANEQYKKQYMLLF